MNFANMFCIRFDFGVPLDDIFPPDNIHPRLCNLFDQIYWTFTNSNMHLSDVLNNNLRSLLKEKLTMVDKCVKGKLHYEDVQKPELYFWLLKHFIELLPLPLFPKQTNSQVCDWLELAVQCKMCRIKSNSLLDSKISCCIQKLPKSNVLLINYLLEFLRKVCSQPNSSKCLNKKNVNAAVKYFCSSMFLYSYEPNIKSTIEKLHYPLLTYLIIYWPRFKKRCSKNSNEISKNNATCISLLSKNNKLLDRGCQTSSWLLLDSLVEDKNVVENLSTISSTISENFSQKSIPLEEQGKCKFSSKNLSAETINKSFASKDSDPTNQKKSPPEREDASYKTVDDLVKKDDKPCEMVNSTFLNSDSQSTMYQTEHLDNESLLAKKMPKLSKSLSSVFSKFSEKIKIKSTTSESDTKIETCKYDLLKNPYCKRMPVSKLSNFTNRSPNIKYKKLTL